MSMGVYIDMEMPKCCDACSFACWSNLHQTGSCYLLDNEQCFDDYSTDYRTKRSEHCPLIEVPEPHGRLGDLDALPWYLANEPVKYSSYEDWEKLCDAIKTAPTVIPASESKERPAFLPTYELTPRREEG